MKSCFANSNRSAVTSMETLVAIIVLAFAAIGVSQFVATVHSGLREQELRQRIGWEVENARELICSWETEEITKERIEQLPLTSGLTDTLSEVRWVSKVSQVEKPIPATRVTLAIECRYQGQIAKPQELTFWVPAENAGE